MRQSISIVLLLSLAVDTAVASPKSLRKIAKAPCAGPICPSGCCPEPGYVCCDDNLYCAETKDDCPEFVMKKIENLVQVKTDYCFMKLVPLLYLMSSLIIDNKAGNT